MNIFEPFNHDRPVINRINYLNDLNKSFNIYSILNRLNNNHNLHIIDLKNKKLSLYIKNDHF